MTRTEDAIQRRYTIDPPPSANKLWKIRSGRIVKTDQYKSWRIAAAWAIRAQHRGNPFTGPALITLSLRRPRANADIDNRIKPVLDALEAGGALVNDKQVTCVTAAWADHDGCRVTVGADMAAAA